MNKEELNAKLGYDIELYNKLADEFDLQEDYQDSAWSKLTDICKLIYNMERENTNLKQALNEIKYELKHSKGTDLQKIESIKKIIDKVGGNEK